MSRLPAFRAALRIARRDAWRAKGRSLLVVLLIGLPVLVLSAVDVGWRTYQLSSAQTLERAIGAADLAVMSNGSGAPVLQRPKGWLDAYGYSAGTAPANAVPPTFAELRRHLPVGSRVLVENQEAQQVAIRTHDGVEYATLTGFDYADPIARGIIHQVSGRAPRTDSEAAITSRMAQDTGLHVGDRMTTFDGRRTFRIVGIVRDNQSRADVAVYSLPGAVAAGTGTLTTWYVRTAAPVSWAAVLGLNKVGFVAISRQAYLHPPPKSQVLFKPPYSSGISTSTVATTGLLGGMALLEVVLLAGPAFAVSARRQRRDLAMIAATGGRRRDLRNVVLANGVVLGLTAGVVGVVSGVGILAAALDLFGSRIDRIPGPFDVRPLELVGIALVSLVTALLAAMFPAWSASRTDVVAALAGQRGQVRIKRRVPFIGLAVAAIGVLVALAGSSTGNSINLILGGVVLTEFGLIILTPSLLTLAGRLGRRLPFAPRLALRDAARNRSSAAPAVAAVMASMIGAIAITIIATSETDLSRREYHPQLPTNVALASLYGAPQGQPQPPTPATAAAALRTNLTTTQVVTVYEPSQPQCASTPGSGAPCEFVNLTLGNDGNRANDPWRYDGGDFSQIMVDDGSSVSAMFGVHLPAAEAALRAGKAVVADAGPVKDGKIELVATTEGSTPTTKTMTIPAVVVTAGYPAAEAVIPPSAEEALLGRPAQAVGVLAVLAHRPSSEQRQAVNKALTELQPGLRITTENGFQSSSQWEIYVLVGAAALIALGAAAVATTLANVDGRSDLVTLGAIGASPRTRRVVSMSRAGVTAGIGCVVGAAAGFIPAIAWIERGTNEVSAALESSGFKDRFPQIRVVIPWPAISLAAIGVPVVAVLVAGVLSRSQLPSERRTD